MKSYGGTAVAMTLVAWLFCAVSGVSASLQGGQHDITPAPTATAIAARATESFTAVSGCHQHGTDVYCMLGTEEYSVSVPDSVTATGELPSTFTGCHHHGTDSYCIAPNDEDVQIIGLEATSDGSGEETSSEETGESEAHGEGQHCHFHAGVEHCVGGDSEESSGPQNCSRQDRDYNIGLRIGLIFVMLVVGLIGAVGPILLATVLPSKFHVVFCIVKQFGTGVIISTAFVHLFTHATLMLTNECLGETQFEATTAAILMAGVFVSFLIEYITHRVAKSFNKKAGYNDEFVGVMILEAGIIFHSILIGITVVVAGDSYFVTLFVVIVFHQMFEGIALGSRIAAVGHQVRGTPTDGSSSHSHTSQLKGEGSITPDNGGAPLETGHSAVSQTTASTWKALPMPKKILMAIAFAVTTPVGMAIGIGVLNTFNGNDPATLWAIGTLDALSAGILVWVGIVEMWAGDWMFDGELVDASPLVAGLAIFGLIAGMALMSFLGKWA